MTNDLPRRIAEHRQGDATAFTGKYGVHRLVWYEPHQDITRAIAREKQLKKWNRAWKIDLIERDNRRWDDRLPELNA